MRETPDLDRTAEHNWPIPKREKQRRRRDYVERGRERRLAKIVIAALGSIFLFGSVAEAAPCLASADEVRKLTPKAWPRWTYGPNRERCWYSGTKPVFARNPPSHVPVQVPPTTQATNEILLPDNNESAEPVKKEWALEYRWSPAFEMRHQARDEPLTYWLGDDGGYDSYGVGPSPPPRQ